LSNLVFSRRAIATLIADLKGILRREQLEGLIARLNNPRTNRIAAMWEVVFLSVLSKIAILRNEIPLASGRRPDFELDIAGTTVVGDITSISDSERHRSNPVEALDAELRRLATRYGLNPNYLDLRVEGARIGLYGDAKVKLSLPNSSCLQEIITQNVKPFLQKAAKTPDDGMTANFVTADYNFTISYIPGKQYGSGSHPGYDIAASLTKNPSFKALERKAKQLRTAPEEAVRLVIACDGGCAPFRSVAGPRDYTAQAIAKKFLTKHKSVDLLFLVTIYDTGVRPDFGKHRLEMRYDLVASPVSSRHERLSDIAFSAIKGALEQAVANVPQPVLTPNNAARRASEDGIGPDMMGAYQLTRTRIRVSARGIQQLLAGQITNAEFAEAHGWSGQGANSNPFLAALGRGEMIKFAKVESGGDRDDDWLEFEFARDAAVSDFDLDS
jgi:hypothetical protein